MMLASITRARDGYALALYRKNGRRAKLVRAFDTDEPLEVIETMRGLGYLKSSRSAGRAWRRGWKGEIVALRPATEARPAQ